VKFTQFTREGRLRAPVFLRLQADREAEDIREPATDTSAVVSVPQDEETDLGALIARLNNAPAETTLDIEGHPVKFTNLDKEFWPAEGQLKAYSKRDMIRYYLQVSPFVLPHLRDRPLTLTRYPDGIRGEFFYQKHWPHEIPAFVQTVRLWSSHVEHDTEYIMVNNLPTLAWLAQLADLELHPWLSRVDPEPDARGRTQTFNRTKARIEASVLNYPDFMNFDLDAYIYSGKEQAGAEPEFNRRAFDKGREIALFLRELLGGLGLNPYVKTSGKTGLHVYVPVMRQYDFDTIRELCGTIGKFLVQQRPKEVTMEWAVKNRTGKIFFDHNMNTRGKNMASVYSLRPALGAPASVPVTWEELKDIYPPDFNIETTPKRLAQVGDLWSQILEDKHDLRGVIEGLGVGM
jgi:bifunctional non-homologous end joining protein LigD